jgi:hypothetical protein
MHSPAWPCMAVSWVGRPRRARSFRFFPPITRLEISPKCPPPAEPVAMLQECREDDALRAHAVPYVAYRTNLPCASTALSSRSHMFAPTAATVGVKVVLLGQRGLEESSRFCWFRQTFVSIDRCRLRDTSGRLRRSGVCRKEWTAHGERVSSSVNAVVARRRQRLPHPKLVEG